MPFSSAHPFHSLNTSYLCVLILPHRALSVFMQRPGHFPVRNVMRAPLMEASSAPTLDFLRQRLDECAFDK